MFGQNGGTTVVNKKLSFLSVLVLSIAGVLICIILSVTGIAIYGLAVVDAKTDGVLGLVEQGIEFLPALREALPPALADGFDDERSPAYREQVDVRVRLPEQGDRRWREGRAVVEVKNRGDRTVTLMSLRLMGLDEHGDLIVERPTWAATPLQIDGEWRGPILPHETRKFAVWCLDGREIAEVNCEITDLRVWKEQSSIPGSHNEAVTKQDLEGRSAT